MKKILAIALLAIGMIAGAQEKNEKSEPQKNMRYRFTPEERTDLRVKQMVADLDLTEKQQKEVRSLVLEGEKIRDAKAERFRQAKESGEQPSKEEMLKMKNEQLDQHIAMKAKMKTILDEKQYQKWEAKMENRRDDMKKVHGEMRGERGGRGEKMEAPKVEPLEIEK